MHDDLQPDLDALEELEGATPPLFHLVLTAGEDETARRDAVALAAGLAERGRAVTRRDEAELVVIGSAAGGAPGRVSLDPASRVLLEGAGCPVAVAPRGFAATTDRELRRVDVGIDGGREATAALTLAAHVARAHDARLRLVAVAELDFDLGGAPRKVDPRELARLARHLEQASDGLPGVRVETDLREGLADQILVGLAKQADLLVLGSRTVYGGAGRVALGAVVTRVLQASPCPTLIAPAP